MATDFPRRKTVFPSLPFNSYSSGGLKANGFVRNNTKDNVTDIFGTFSIKSSGETIATADFSLGEQQFGVLNSGDNRPWSLIYKKNQVLIPLESIETYSVDLDVSYEIKQ